MISQNDREITGIILEEAAAYFNGKKQAKKLQS
jgi:hypothetical protein